MIKSSLIMIIKNTIYTFLLLFISCIGFNIQAQNCSISPFVTITSPPAGSSINPTDTLELSVPPVGAIFGTPSPPADIMWGLYLSEPTNTNPEADEDNYQFIVLSDENGDEIYGSGQATIANTNILYEAPFNTLPAIEFCIVPIINVDPAAGTVIDDSCTGVIPGSSPVFCYTVCNPFQDPTCIEENNCEEAVSYDDCETAEALTIFDGINGPYDNTCTTFDATTDILSQSCFDNDIAVSTAWFSFTGNGNEFNISILNCENSENEQLSTAQVTLYSGSCNSLNVVDCATAINDIATLNTLVSETDVTYYVMVDGLGENKGEFCIDVEEIVNTTCEPIVSAAIVNNGNIICLGDDIDIVFDDAGVDGYTTTLVLVDATNTIIQNSLDIGDYTAIVITFANDDTDIINGLLAVGNTFPTDFSAANCEPAQISTPFSIEDCTPPCEPNAGVTTVNDGNTICENEEVIVSVSGTATGDYITMIVIANSNNIIQFMDENSFSGVLPVDSYTVLTINFAVSESDNVIPFLNFDQTLPTSFNTTDCPVVLNTQTISVLPINASECAGVICDPNVGIGLGINTATTEICLGTSTSVSLIGEISGESYTNLVAVADADDVVILTPLPGEVFTFSEVGDYTVTVVNYKLEDTNLILDLFAIGNTLTTDFSAAYCTPGIASISLSVSECIDDCEASVTFIEANAPLDICPTGETGVFSVVSNSANAEYTSSLIITEIGGDTIEGVAVSGSGISPSTFGLAAGNYCVHPINYLSSDWAAIDDIIGGSASLNDIVNAIEAGTICAELNTDLCVSITILEANNSACLEALDVIDLVVMPSADGSTFSVTFNIVGGTGNYTVDNVEIAGSTFTSEDLPCDTFYGFSISDDANSSIIIVEGTFACVENCTSDAGTMTGDFQLVCDIETLSFANNSDEIIGENAVLSYYLHTDENDVFGSNIANNSAGTFDISGLNENIDYYVSTVVGVTDENGNIIAEHPCTVVSPNSDSFVKLAPITITVDGNCDFTTGLYTIVAQFDGGLPAYDATATYTVTGDISGTFFASEEGTAFIEEGVATSYQINATDGFCTTASESDDFYCEKTPIELISFTGEVQVRGNLLKWATASELDNDYFTIERSTDGYNFEAITFVSAEGSSLTTLRYEFLDKQALNGVSYYRLLQTDFDGTTTVSATITLKRNEADFGFNDIYPVPANDFVEVSFNVVEDVRAEIQIFNLAGSLMATYNENAIKGTNSMTVDVSNYSAGVYFVTVNIGTDVISGRLIKN